MSPERLEHKERDKMLELRTTPETEAACIAPSGLGFGEGAISYAARAETEVQVEELSKVTSIIASPRVLTPIDVDKHTGELLDDDGCGDGRGITNQAGDIVEVTQGDKVLKKSLNRSKVFGGGATMALATRIAIGEAKNKQLSELFSESMQLMDEAEVDFGAHSDDHAHGEKSGCGAIDNAPKIIENTLTYRDEIYETILSLDDGIDAQILDSVLDNYAHYAEVVQQGNYSGKQVLDEIKGEEKVVKKLVAGHSEMYIVLNEVEGYSVNQHTVRDATHEQVQVFAVDLWRVHDIANRLYETEDDETKQQAVLGELVYTLATAATLTAGDLPVYRISEKHDNLHV